MTSLKPFHNGLEKVRYLFIDGGCLDTILDTFSKELFSGQEIEIDYNCLADGYQKVFYYDCLPAQKKDEDDSEYKTRIQPKLKLFHKLRSLDKFHVYEGTARFRDKRRGQEQKQVDIMIAVDMLTHSFRRNMHEATLLAGDLDFKPLIDALVQDGMYVSLWYPKGKANYELVDAADSKIPLKIDRVKNWFTYSFKAKMKLPSNAYHQEGDLDVFYEQVDYIKQANYEAFFYEKSSDDYAAVVPHEGDYPHEGDDYFLKHDNLNQLKFYVDHLYGLDVLRPDVLGT